MAASLVVPICLRIARSTPDERHVRSLAELDFESADDLPRDLLLHAKNIPQLGLVALGPEVLVGAGIDQLCGDAKTLATPSHTPFEDVSDSQLPGDLRQSLLRSFIVHRRRAGDHPQLRNARKTSDDFLR